jgi:hypothetical protein
MYRLLLLFMFCLTMASCGQYRQGSDQKENFLPQVKKANLNMIDPTLFSEEEWYVPYYFKHFSQVANSVVDTGENRGFINIAVWRPQNINQPFNARIMENILSLAWFYTKKRPWNIYYGDPALRSRLEAALNFWCRIQNEDGQFSEYSPGQWSLAPTAFATKFVGRALYLLHDGPPIDKEMYERARKAYRKALYVSFTDENLWEHGKKYTNQYANLWSGALMYLEVWPDKEVESLFHQRFDQSMSAFQSSCGFFYEAGGPDWGYDLSTHHSDLDLAWNFSKGTDLQNKIAEKMRQWYDWFCYNAVQEPGTNFFYLNRAIETRQHHGYVQKSKIEDPSSERGVPEAEFVPAARAFELSKEELSRAIKNQYDSMRKQYPQVASLNEGAFWAFSPYAFLHDGLIQWHPSAKQKNEALSNLPYLKSKRFTQERHDDLSNTSYTFVRRPAYYAIFNSGKIVTPQQRFGLGLVWNPGMGTVFQSQSKTDEAAWGTRASGNKQVFEAADLFPTILVDGKTWKEANGIHDLSPKIIVIKYALGDKGEKTIRFEDGKIAVDVIYPGGFTEILPLLMHPNDQLQTDQNRISLQTASGKMQVKLQNGQSIERKLFGEELGIKKCNVLAIKAKDHLSYTINFSTR